MDDAFVPVGRVGRPHGLDGAFVVERGSDDESRYTVGAVLHVGGVPATVVVSRRVGRGRRAIRLDRAVERGATLAIPRAELAVLPDGEYYTFEIVGLRVEEVGGSDARDRAGRASGLCERQPGARRWHPRADDRGRDPCDRPEATASFFSTRASSRDRYPAPGASRRLHPGSARLRLADRAETPRHGARHGARAPPLQLPRHDPAPLRPGRRYAVRRRCRNGAASRRGRGSTGGGLRK